MRCVLTNHFAIRLNLKARPSPSRGGGGSPVQALQDTQIPGVGGSVIGHLACWALGVLGTWLKHSSAEGSSPEKAPFGAFLAHTRQASTPLGVVSVSARALPALRPVHSARINSGAVFSNFFYFSRISPCVKMFRQYAWHRSPGQFHVHSCRAMG